MKIAAMVTLYNPTKENINNIKCYIDEVDKVYLIDNSDVDNSSILFDDKKIIYLPNHENLGMARALNIACSHAIEDKYDWLLTMDQDSKLSSESLKEMKKYITNNDTKNVGIVSAYHDVITHRIKADTDVEECLDVMTSGNLLNLDIYQKIGGFKDWLFIDYVDIEYCLNLNKNDYKVIRLNNVILPHQLGNTVMKHFFKKEVICSNHIASRRYYMVRNMNYVYDMYYDTYPEFCNHIKRVQKGQVKNIIVFEKDKIRKLYMMYKGYRDYKKNIKGKMK